MTIDAFISLATKHKSALIGSGGLIFTVDKYSSVKVDSLDIIFRHLNLNIVTFKNVVDIMRLNEDDDSRFLIRVANGNVYEIRFILSN